MAGVMLHSHVEDSSGVTLENDIQYLHRDHLGSVDVISGETGSETVAYNSYSPFGGRRNATTWSQDSSVTSDLNRGFTGHEHLDEVGLIHMNGRVYDPVLGRFLSADLVVQAPQFSQSYNRYSYTLNNPLSFTDPTGYFYERGPDGTWIDNGLTSDPQQGMYYDLYLSHDAQKFVGGVNYLGNDVLFTEYSGAVYSFDGVVNSTREQMNNMRLSVPETGIPISSIEHQFNDAGNREFFWALRDFRGDPVGEVARDIIYNRTAMAMATNLNLKASLLITNSDLNLNDFGIKVMNEHVFAVGRDFRGNVGSIPGALNPDQIDAYHYELFKSEGLLDFSYGGSLYQNNLPKNSLYQSGPNFIPGEYRRSLRSPIGYCGVNCDQ
ncbi:MAG: RHS repeat domain-containing protein [Pseudomonadota bacterium]